MQRHVVWHLTCHSKHYGPLWKQSAEPIIWLVQEHFSANHLTDNDKTKHNYDQQLNTPL